MEYLVHGHEQDAGPLIRAARRELYRFFSQCSVSVIRLPLWHTSAMRIAKPLLMVTTPIGVVAGLYECIRLAGGLVIVMLAMVGVMLAALASVIVTVRREARAARPAAAAAPDASSNPEAICKS